MDKTLKNIILNDHPHLDLLHMPVNLFYYIQSVLTTMHQSTGTMTITYPLIHMSQLLVNTPQVLMAINELILVT